MKPELMRTFWLTAMGIVVSLPLKDGCCGSYFIFNKTEKGNV